MRQFKASLDKKGRLRGPENHSQVETRLVIRPITVRVNCQIRGLTSIRKGLRKDDTPFLVSSNSIIALENVSGRVSGENFKSPHEAFFYKSGGVPIRWGPVFTNPEGSHFANPEASHFVNPEGYCFFKT